MIFVPLPENTVLNVTAPCSVGELDGDRCAHASRGLRLGPGSPIGDGVPIAYDPASSLLLGDP